MNKIKTAIVITLILALNTNIYAQVSKQKGLISSTNRSLPGLQPPKQKQLPKMYCCTNAILEVGPKTSKCKIH